MLPPSARTLRSHLRGSQAPRIRGNSSLLPSLASASGRGAVWESVLSSPTNQFPCISWSHANKQPINCLCIFRAWSTGACFADTRQARLVQQTNQAPSGTLNPLTKRRWGHGSEPQGRGDRPFSFQRRCYSPPALRSGAPSRCTLLLALDSAPLWRPLHCPLALCSALFR